MDRKKRRVFRNPALFFRPRFWEHGDFPERGPARAYWPPAACGFAHVPARKPFHYNTGHFGAADAAMQQTTRAGASFL
ncbi:hypothetical protein ACFSHT_07860 [Paraburkholderia silviterrae]|uniref:hypothetical protein n=1 Tax=Paraburkholderia silviterrae TaxID=2528715 RepID=UPI00196B8D37|nr:hypothetical protein [Paraburkholderia silviterrae]